MSQDFRFKYDRMRENNPTGTGGENQGTENYETVGHTRNICFAWLDGRRLFLNYSYLVSGEYNSENGTITLTFTTHKVLLKGVFLDLLHAELMDHIPRVIYCVESRYNSLLEKVQFAVNEIIVTDNGS